MESLKESPRRMAQLSAALIFFIIVTCFVSLATGHLPISPSEVWQTLMGSGTDRNNLLLYQFRLPRLVIALIVGAGIGVSGAIFQGVTQNSLADPGILGINSGAGLAVVLYLYFSAGNIENIGQWGAIGLPFAALIGGFFAAVLIYLLAWKNGLTPIRLVLVGIGINSGFGALLILFQLKMNERDFNRATVWLSGSIWNASWSAVISVLPWVLILIPLALYKSRIVDILQLGDMMAVGLGTSVESERAKLLFIAVALAGASVSVAGGIAFLGLGAPHLARRLIGGKYRRLIPISALMGSLLLLISDIVARTVLAPSEIPVGLVVSVLGAPYFIYLLVTVEN